MCTTHLNRTLGATLSHSLSLSFSLHLSLLHSLSLSLSLCIYICIYITFCPLLVILLSLPSPTHKHTHTCAPTRTVMLIGIHACCTKSNLRTAVVDMIAAGECGKIDWKPCFFFPIDSYFFIFHLLFYLRNSCDRMHIFMRIFAFHLGTACLLVP